MAPSVQGKDAAKFRASVKHSRKFGARHNGADIRLEYEHRILPGPIIDDETNGGTALSFRCMKGLLRPQLRCPANLRVCASESRSRYDKTEHEKQEWQEK